MFDNTVLRIYLGLKGTRKHGSGEEYKARSPIICTLSRYNSGDQMKNETGRARGMYGRQEKRIEF